MRLSTSISEMTLWCPYWSMCAKKSEYGNCGIFCNFAISQRTLIKQQLPVSRPLKSEESAELGNCLNNEIENKLERI